MSGLAAGSANELILQCMWEQMKAPVMLPVSTHRAPWLLPGMLPLSSHHLRLPTASDLPSPARMGTSPSPQCSSQLFLGALLAARLQCLCSDVSSLPAPISPSFLALWSSHTPKSCMFQRGTFISHPFFVVPVIFSQLGHTQGVLLLRTGKKYKVLQGFLHQKQRFLTTQSSQSHHQSSL